MSELIEFQTIATGSSGNAYILSVGDDKLLIECGVELKHILKANGNTIDNIYDCLVTHKHKDHCKAIEAVLNSGVFVWCNLPTYIEGCTVVEYEKKTYLKNNRFYIYAIQGKHDAEVAIYQIVHASGKSFVFATDTAEIPIDFCADYFFVECNYDEQTIGENSQNGSLSVCFKNERVGNTHLSLEYLKKYFTDLGTQSIKGIVLLHQSKDNLNREIETDFKNLFDCNVYSAMKDYTIRL